MHISITGVAWEMQKFRVRCSEPITFKLSENSAQLACERGNDEASEASPWLNLYLIHRLALCSIRDNSIRVQPRKLERQARKPKDSEGDVRNLSDIIMAGPRHNPLSVSTYRLLHQHDEKIQWPWSGMA